MRFTHDPQHGRVVFGAAAARESLTAEVDRLGGQRVLLVTTPRGEALARELTAPLGARLVATFTGAREHVPVEAARAARALAGRERADLVLSIGGGSTTGTAKAVALTTALPVLAVPTTYAGSEVTPVWGMTDGQRKTTGTDPAVLPAAVVYDPDLLAGLPEHLAVASGMNAMAHSVEALWAPGGDPVTDALAQRSIAALADGLRALSAPGGAAPADAQRSRAAAREDLLLGAWLAGTVLATAGSGLHHKICHVLGGAYGLPHAPMHAAVLPHVLAWNAPAAPRAAAAIARALDADGAGDATTALAALAREVGAPAALQDLGLEEADLEEATDLVLDVLPPGNPRPTGRDDVAALLRAAWAGPPASAGPRLGAGGREGQGAT